MGKHTKIDIAEAIPNLATGQEFKSYYDLFIISLLKAYSAAFSLESKSETRGQNLKSKKFVKMPVLSLNNNNYI